MFLALICDWRLWRPGHPDAMLALREAFLPHVWRATARYPDAYFDFCEKGRDSVEMLTDELLARCDGQMVLRQPFLGREPFTAYLQDRTVDAQVRFHTFYGRFSLLKDQLKKNYAENLRIDSRVRAQAELWAEVGPVLPRVAEHTGKHVGRYPIWRAKPTPEGAETSSPSSLEARVLGALQVLGEATQARIVQHLRSSGAQDPAPAGPTTDPTDPSGGHVNRAAVRAATQRAWDSFDAEEQDLMFALMMGSPLEELTQRRGAVPRGAELTQIFIRLDGRFRAELAAELGGPVPPRASRKDDPEAPLPRTLGLLIFEVLCEIVPAWRHRKVTRDAMSLRAPLPIPLPGAAAKVVEPLSAEEAEACLLVWDALFHPQITRDLGLSENLLTAIGAAAWESDPARALAEAEYDEGFYVGHEMADWDDDGGS